MILLDHTCSDGPATFTNSKPELFLHSNRGNELNLKVDVITGHNHFNTFGQCADTGHISGPEVKLRTITGEERCVPPAFLLGQNVDGRIELRMRCNGSRFRDNLTSFHFLPFGASEENPDVVTRPTFIERFAEHFHTGADGLERRSDPNDFHFLTGSYNTAINPAGHNGATARNGKHISSNT